MTEHASAQVSDQNRAINLLRPDPHNARRHTPAQIDEIAASIRRFGMVAPIIIRPNGMIIGGHATWVACQNLGHRTINCRVVHNLSESAYQALGLALNRLPEHSKWDDTLLMEALQTIAAEDAMAAGFSQAELAKLAEEPEPITVEEIDASIVADEFWISVRGPLKHQAVMLRALRMAAEELDGVTVDLGTIEI